MHPATRCLGAISFSLYLLHGIVFKLLIYALNRAGLASLSPVVYWLMISAVACATVGLCAVTYRWIEFPFLSISRPPRPVPKN